MKPNTSFIFEAGKKVMKWGKGYAWNPVSFIDRPKNPEDPEEALEGTTVATADYIRSFDGPLKTLTLTTALIPVYKYVNAKFGEPRRTNFAAKLYLLLYDTDIRLHGVDGIEPDDPLRLRFFEESHDQFGDSRRIRGGE